jgi:hypothetical protein
MDPSTKPFVWPRRTLPRTQLLIARVLWTLKDHGPVSYPVSNNLVKLLTAEGWPAPEVKVMSQHVRSLRDHYGATVDIRENGRGVHRMALRPGVALPPFPHGIDERPEPGPKPKPVRARQEPLPQPPEPEEGPSPAMSPGDALAAVASFVTEALALAGVSSHAADADERLAEAQEEVARLHSAMDAQAEQLVTKLRENEVLRRALARRNGLATGPAGRS